MKIEKTEKFKNIKSCLFEMNKIHKTLAQLTRKKEKIKITNIRNMLMFHKHGNKGIHQTLCKSIHLDTIENLYERHRLPTFINMKYII